MNDLENDNSSQFPPVEIVKQGKEAVKIWLERNKKYSINEAKVLFVGEGAVGKTSVMKQLLRLQFNANEPETKGINISDLQVNHNDTNITLHLWDFGGQEYMHSTHQFFLSRRSLYVLVLDGRKEEKKDYWLKVIESFGGNSPVVVVMNKIDTNKNFDLNRKFLQEKYPSIHSFYRISCATGEGIENLMEGLSHIVSEIEMVKTPWIKAWFEIKNKLMAVTHDFISYEQFFIICNELDVTDEQEQDILIEYLDNLGVLLHFREFDLANTHILNPQWVTDAVYRIMNCEQIASNNGRLELKWVKEILKKRNDQDFFYPIDKQHFVIQLMQKFELCFKFEEDIVLIPDLLNIAEPNFELNKADALKIIIRYEDFLPKSIIPRLMVKMSKDIKNLWRTGIIFENKTYLSRAIVKTDDDKNIMYIYIDGKFRRDYYSILRNNLYEINDFYKSGFNELIPCDCNSCINKENPTFYEYMKLKEFKKYGRENVICDNPPFHNIKIVTLIDDLLNHKPVDPYVELLKNILWCAGEIQRKHISLHNDENRYNDLLQSLLKAKDYIAEEEVRIGKSESGKNVGRLDLQVSKNGKIIGLIEAFKLRNFKKNGVQYTANHLLKLLRNYNPSGVKHCFAICYVELSNFSEVWEDYKEEIRNFVFYYDIPKNEMQDLTDEYNELNGITDIKLGLTVHSREGQLIKLYHVFINMDFSSSFQISDKL